MIYFSELGGGGHITKALHRCPASLPGVHRAVEPPDPIPNSEVKRSIADGSVGSPHVRVGQRQALTLKAPLTHNVTRGFLLSHIFAVKNEKARVNGQS